MLKSMANIAKRLVPDIAKLLGTSWGGPMVGAVAQRLTEEALQRVADAVTRYLAQTETVPIEGPDAMKVRVEQFEASLATNSVQVESLRQEIKQITEDLREAYIFEFYRSEMEREVIEHDHRNFVEVVSDRERTRAHNLTLTRESLILAYAPAILSLLILVGFFYCAFQLITDRNNSSENKELLYLVLGALTTSVSAVVTYWFGSSAEATRRSVTQQYEQTATQRTEAERSASIRQQIEAQRSASIRQRP